MTVRVLEIVCYFAVKLVTVVALSILHPSNTPWKEVVASAGLDVLDFIV